MATLLIEDVDEALHRGLAERAAAHHRSPADEARELLRAAIGGQGPGPREHIVDAAERLFGPEHGVDLDMPPRGSAPGRPPPDFSDMD